MTRTMRVGCHAYPLRDVEPFSEMLATVAEAGFTGFEFNEGFPSLVGADPNVVADARELLADEDLVAVAARTGLDELSESLQEFLDVYLSFDVEHVVVPGFDEERLASPEGVDGVATDLDEVAAALPDGVRLHWHNHGGLFETVDSDRTIFEALMAATDDDVGIELDVGWAAADGADSAELIRRYADRIDLLHVADYHPERGMNVELGEGVVDWAAVADATADAGVEWLSYDCDEPPSLPASLSRSAAFINDFSDR